MLPPLSVPRWTRVAKRATEAIEETLGFKAIILDHLRHRLGDYPIVIAERINENIRSGSFVGHLRHFLKDVNIDEIDDDERSIIERLLNDGRTRRGPFSRLKWIDEALDWIRVAPALMSLN